MKKQPERKKKTLTGDLPPVIEFNKEGDFVDGIYIGSRKAGVFRSSIYEIDQKGNHFAVWGGVQLDMIMENIKVGQWIGIRFLGRVPSPTTGQDMKRFEVEVYEDEMKKGKDDIPF